MKEHKGNVVSRACALLAEICAFEHAQYQFWQLYLHHVKTSVWHFEGENVQRGEDFTLHILGPRITTVKYLDDNILFILESWGFCG